MSRTRAPVVVTPRHTRASRRTSIVGAALLGLVSAAALTGCSASTEEQAAAQAALAFAAASRADPLAACALLAPRTRDELERSAEQSCAEALPDQDLPASTVVTRTDLAGHSAKVELDGQTVFLSLFDSGWRVVAAGCSKAFDEPATPYTCQVQGS
ncbi:MAG: hypothetical protein ACOYBY_05495 [Dermatophilaceae bacterium]